MSSRELSQFAPAPGAEQSLPGGGVWAELAGQEEAVAVLQAAASAARSGEGGTGRAMTHAWLVTGPPGSGRSVAARAFAAALQCTDPKVAGCGRCQACRTTLAGTHLDVKAASTAKMQITRDEVRELLDHAYTKPATGRRRVIIVEDYDRITEADSNILLRSIEEPGLYAVWVLCAPSLADVLPTIRSRCRHLQLRIPSVEAVAQLLVRRDGAELDSALRAARTAQSHIGLARALVADPELAAGRGRWLERVAQLRTVSDAVWTAQALLDRAEEQDRISNDALFAQERSALLRSLGAGDSERLPPALRAAVKDLEEGQKRRSKRSRTDVLDRLLQDLASLYRDVLVYQLGGQVPSINPDLAGCIEGLASQGQAQLTLQRLEDLRQTRLALRSTAAPLALLESLFVKLRPPSPVNRAGRR